MKRKLFTLLLAIGVLTAFQTNAQAQMKVRFLADSSGLAKTSFGEDDRNKDDPGRYDSFPRVKKAGLFNWLSYSEEKSELRLKRSTSLDTVFRRNPKDSVKVMRDLLGDKESVFSLKFFGTDSTNFQIFPKNSEKPIGLDHAKGGTKVFSILKVRTTDNTGDDYKKNGVLANFPPKWPVKDGNDLKGDTIEGYLAYVPDHTPEKLRLDTLDVTVALVGYDKKEEKLSMRYFNEFAFYSDSLPLLLQRFHFAKDNPTAYEKGRLYRTDSFPYFQLYDNGEPLIKSSRNTDDGEKEDIHERGHATNWGHRNHQYDHRANPNDTCVYSWLDLQLKDDAIVLPGYAFKNDGSILRDSSVTVRLDALRDTAMSYENNEKSPVRFYAFDTDKYKPNEDIKRWGVKWVDDKVDSLVFLTKDGDDRLSFTVKKRSSGQVSDWTNGYPKSFVYKGTKDKGLLNGTKEREVYYAVDTTFMALLDTAYVRNFVNGKSAEATIREKVGLPYDSLGNRYAYSEDDSWRPLYVKVQYVNDSTEAKSKYEYVGQRWLEDKKLFDKEVKQKVVIEGTSDRSISGEEGYITVKEGDGASFYIRAADTIRNTVRNTADKKWFVLLDPDKDLYANNRKEFEIEDSVELFHIENKEGSLRLTVSEEKSELASAVSPLKNKMEWAKAVKSEDENKKDMVRQMFAIVRNCLDDTYSLLPVAAPHWAKYDAKSDSLSFNLAIGRDNKDGKFVDLKGAWRIESTPGQQVLVADSTTEREPLKFSLTSPVHLWNRETVDFVAIKDVKETASDNKGKYYRGDGTYTKYTDATDDKVRKNDIGALWKIERQSTEKEANGRYKFTPVVKLDDKDKKHPFASEEVTVYSEDDEVVYLEWKGDGKDAEGNDVKKHDTIRIANSVAPEEFDLYKGLVGFDWKGSDKGYITLQSGDSRYLSYYDDKGDVRYDNNETEAITIHKDKELTDLFDESEHYKAQYYRFSHKKDKENHFLKVDGDQLKWEKSENADDDEYRFSFPKAIDGKFYLQSKTGRLVQVSKDGTKLSLTDGDLYKTLSVINDADDKEAATLQWTIAEKEVSLWEHVDLGEDNIGVLAARRAEVFISRDEDRKGILSDKKDRTVLLKLEEVPSPQSVVAYSSTGVSDRKDYKISHSDSLYLMDRDDKVVFEKTEDPHTFAFQTTDDGFAIVRGDEDQYRYLSSTGFDLIFTDNDNEKISFVWAKPGDYGITTGIKVINATSAKAYGVSGGVKVANTSGAVSIYTVDGRLVTTQAVTSPNQTITVPAGIYIVRNGAEVTKVVVK